jgi:hypothetical protein
MSGFNDFSNEIKTESSGGVCYVGCHTLRKIQVLATTVPISVEADEWVTEFTIKNAPPKNSKGYIHVSLKYTTKDWRQNYRKAAILIVTNVDGKPFLHYKGNAEEIWYPVDGKITQFYSLGYYRIHTKVGIFTNNPDDNRSKYRYVDPQTILEYIADDKNVGDLQIAATELEEREDELQSLRNECERLREDAEQNQRNVQYKMAELEDAQAFLKALDVDDSAVLIIQDHLKLLHNTMDKWGAFNGENRYMMIKYIELIVMLLNRLEIGASDDQKILFDNIKKGAINSLRLLTNYSRSRKKAIKDEVFTTITAIDRFVLDHLSAYE